MLRGDIAAEVRRQRDEIGREMERIVKRMQELEAEIEAKVPPLEPKRAQLADLRNELAGVRQRMRRVAETAAVASQQSLAAPTAPKPRSSNNGASPEALRAQQGVPYPDRQGSQSRSSLPRTGVPPPVALAMSAPRRVESDATATSGTLAPKVEEYRLKLQTKHRREKALLDREYERLCRAMDERHQQEMVSMEDRCRQEAAQLREFYEAKQRMEEAQRRIDALHAAGALGTDEGDDTVPLEVGTLQQAQLGMNTPASALRYNQ